MTKYKVNVTTDFKKGLKKAKKQGKDLNKLEQVVVKLADGKILDEKYRNHTLVNSKNYKNCWECHIEPDWLLVYQYFDYNLILILVNLGSHNEIF